MKMIDAVASLGPYVRVYSRVPSKDSTQDVVPGTEPIGSSRSGSGRRVTRRYSASSSATPATAPAARVAAPRRRRRLATDLEVPREGTVEIIGLDGAVRLERPRLGRGPALRECERLLWADRALLDRLRERHLVRPAPELAVAVRDPEVILLAARERHLGRLAPVVGESEHEPNRTSDLDASGRDGERHGDVADDATVTC